MQQRSHTIKNEHFLKILFSICVHRSNQFGENEMICDTTSLNRACMYPRDLL